MASKRKTLVLSKDHADAVELARNVIGDLLDAEQQATENPSQVATQARFNRTTWQRFGDAWKDLGDVLDRWAKADPESSYGTGYEVRGSTWRNPQGDYKLVQNIAANETEPGVPAGNLVVLQNGDGECFLKNTDTDPEWAR
jgi:hypothetical protein